MNEPRMNPRLARLPRAFSHPGYWLALALLVLNDHLLKGAGLPFAPGWLTGKLSDLAGLVVAPPLLALLLLAAFGARGARIAPLVAPALIGAAFTVIKVDVTAAHAAEALFRTFGVASRIWVDPTDLLALAVLPFASTLCRVEPLRFRSFHKPVVAIAAFACIATTGGDEDEGSATEIPELVNETEEALIVHIASTNGAGGCRIYLEDRVGVLTPDAFALRREVVMAPGARASLSGDLAVPHNKDCGAAWVTLPDGRQELVYWSDLGTIESFVPDDDGRRVARRVVLRGETNRFRFEIGDDLSRFELSPEPVDTNCMGPTPEYTVEATALTLAPGFYEVASVTVDEADGCRVVEWRSQASEPVVDTQRLCIPEWAFPFEVGEAVSVIEELRSNGARRLRFTRFNEDNRLSRQLTIWNHASDAWGSHVAKLVAEDCVGSILECGAYSRPIQVELPGDEGVIISGDEAELRDGNDEIRVLIGEGREIGWSTAACMAEEARAGISVNMLELRTD
jgi:hypothetical protein